MGTVPFPSKQHRKQKRVSTVDVTLPGRVRVNDMLTLLRISRTTLYRRLEAGRYPKPDGHDGQMPYWKTGTVRRLLDEEGS